MAHTVRGHPDAAMVCCEQTVQCRTNNVGAHHHRGDALANQGRLPETVERYGEASASSQIIPYCTRPGASLARMEKYDEAVASYREAIRLRPATPRRQRPGDRARLTAEPVRRGGRVLSPRPSRPRPLSPRRTTTWATPCATSAGSTRAFDCYRKAIELKPDYADAHNNLGIAYAELGRFDEAVASYTRCLKLRPNHVDAHMNRALTWLRKGDYAQGWAEYEWRWKKRSLTNRPLIMPQWNGFPLAGRRILLITEQGLGDTLQFVRFCQVLKRQGAGAVILECPERLVKVLSRTPGIDHLVPQGQPLPDYDVYCPLMNVPGLTRTPRRSGPPPRRPPAAVAPGDRLARYGDSRRSPRADDTKAAFSRRQGSGPLDAVSFAGRWPGEFLEDIGGIDVASDGGRTTRRRRRSISVTTGPPPTSRVGRWPCGWPASSVGIGPVSPGRTTWRRREKGIGDSGLRPGGLHRRLPGADSPPLVSICTESDRSGHDPGRWCSWWRFGRRRRRPPRSPSRVIPFEQSAIGEDGGEVGQKGGGPSMSSRVAERSARRPSPRDYPLEISTRTRQSTTDAIEDW